MVKCIIYTFLCILKTVLNVLSFYLIPFLLYFPYPLSCLTLTLLSTFLHVSPLSFPLFSPSFILPSLSLPSPDDSRTTALAQTWPTLMQNTRCAEEDKEVVERGRGENQGWLSIHFKYNQLGKQMSIEAAIVDQLFTIIS